MKPSSTIYALQTLPILRVLQFLNSFQKIILRWVPVKKKLKDGRWYWSVSQIDAEGNESELSAVRSFFALKGKPEQHTIEPSEGFRTSASLMPDLRFTWKCNLPENFETTLQIATDVSFRAIIVSKKKAEQMTAALRSLRVHITGAWFLLTELTVPNLLLL